jgi:hypothetical protein
MKVAGSPDIDAYETVNRAAKEFAALHGIGLQQIRRMRVAGIGPKFMRVSSQISSGVGRMLYLVGPARLAVGTASGGRRNGDPG